MKRLVILLVLLSIILVGIPSCSSGEATHVTGSLQVHFIDVGQGDSILIVSPDGKTALIDGGEADSGALQYLQSKSIKHLDLMIATHPHSDHIGGLVQVLNTIPVDEVVTNGQSYTTGIYEQFLDAITTAKAKYIEVKRNDTISFGNLSFNVLSPVNNTYDDLNNNSLVLRLAYGNDSLLFMGDAGTPVEEDILSTGITIKSTILKVGHHGSQYASTPSFLTKVKPEVAIYSCGLNNSYGHPSPNTLTFLANVGSLIYGTDYNGSIIIESDGNTYTVIGAKTSTPRMPPTPTPTIIRTSTPTPTAASVCACYSYTLKKNIPCSQAGAICRDGTCSLSTGSGTCSHHGGVAR